MLYHRLLQLTHLPPHFFPQLCFTSPAWPRLILLYSSLKKSWKYAGHSSIYFSGTWDLVGLNLRSHLLPWLWEQGINNLHFWGRGEMELQSSAALHNLPFYSYFLIFLPPYPHCLPYFTPQILVMSTVEQLTTETLLLLCLYDWCGRWVTVQTWQD